MNTILKTTLIGLFFGTFGTTIGGVIGITFKNTSNKALSFILSFASGLMISIVCFDLIPEALELDSISNIIMGIIFGVVMMIICDMLVQKKFNSSEKETKTGSSLLRTGIVVSIRISTTQLPRRASNRFKFWRIYKIRVFLSDSNCNSNLMEHLKQIQEIFREIKDTEDTKIEIDIEKLVYIGELPDEDDFGGQLAYYRRVKKLTQPELGEMVGVDRHAIKAYEHNQRFPQNLDIIKNIMEILDMPKDVKLPKYLEVSLNTSEKLKKYLESVESARKKKVKQIT